MKPPSRPCLVCGKAHWGECDARDLRTARGDVPEVSRGLISVGPKERANVVAVAALAKAEEAAHALYAPAGRCEFCDRRRARDAERVRRHREKRRSKGDGRVC
jgi:hypothetical protein